MTEIDARPLAVTRIIVGSAATIRGVLGWDMLSRFDSPLIVRMPVVDWLPDPASGASTVVVAVWIAAAIAFAVGWKVTATGTALATAIAVFVVLDYQTYSNHLYLMVLLVVLLVVADAGVAHSARSNRLGQNKAGPTNAVPSWPVMLIKLQITLVYAFSAVSKFNDEFLTGRVLAGTLRDGLVPFPDALRTPAILGTVAAFAVASELFLAIFLWRPRFRPAAFLVGLGLHTSITLLMGATTELLVFSLLMLGTYPLFIDQTPIRIVWDDTCSSCRTWIDRFVRFDGLGLLVPLGKTDPSHAIDPVAVSHTMHVLSPQTSTGFAAVTQILERTVPSLWVAPVLRLPGVRHVGERWYRWQADRRSCEVSGCFSAPRFPLRSATSCSSPPMPGCGRCYGQVKPVAL